jgi:hypothetical protein
MTLSILPLLEGNKQNKAGTKALTITRLLLLVAFKAIGDMSIYVCGNDET